MNQGLLNFVWFVFLKIFLIINKHKLLDLIKYLNNFSNYYEVWFTIGIDSKYFNIYVYSNHKWIYMNSLDVLSFLVGIYLEILLVLTIQCFWLANYLFVYRCRSIVILPTNI